MPAKKENRMRKEFEEKDIHQEVRLNKYLSEAGVCSRREADRLIEEGKVFVDGVRAENGRKVTDEMEIIVNGKRCSRGQKMVLLAFHKPEGVVCTTDRRWNDVTEGLLLVTNNGDIINQIMRAGNYHEKEYLVTVDKPVTEEFVEQMSRGGIPVLDARTRPCKVEKIGKYRFRIILTQGLNRQIRRMCEYCGCRVKKLVRVRVMNIELGNLPKGQYRDVTEVEMQELYRQLRAGNKKAGKSRRGTWTKNARE